MKFKLDEHLHEPAISLFRAAGHDVHTVDAEGLGGRPDSTVGAAADDEGRILVTLDKGFSATRLLAPKGAGFALVTLRPATQDARAITRLVERLLNHLADHPHVGPDPNHLWTVDEQGVRLSRVPAT